MEPLLFQYIYIIQIRSHTALWCHGEAQNVCNLFITKRKAFFKTSFQLCFLGALSMGRFCQGRLFERVQISYLILSDCIVLLLARSYWRLPPTRFDILSELALFLLLL